jgi:hypothetical protein
VTRIAVGIVERRVRGPDGGRRCTGAQRPACHWQLAFVRLDMDIGIDAVAEDVSAAIDKQHERSKSAQPVARSRSEWSSGRRAWITLPRRASPGEPERPP